MRTLIVLILFFFMNLLVADQLTFVTWNMGNLHHETDACVRKANPPTYPDCNTPRSDGAFDVLKTYAQELNPDVIALQEVHSPDAVLRVFGGQYQVFMSGRYHQDKKSKLVPCSKQGCDGTDGIYTAIAVKSSIAAEEKINIGSKISIPHNDNGIMRPTRWATVVELKGLPVPIKFYSIHLKSSCHSGDLIGASKEDCKTLLQQIPILEKYIDDDISNGFSEIVAGDFNRRIVYHRSGDELWAALDDHSPSFKHNLSYVPYLNPKSGKSVADWWTPCPTVKDAWWAKRGPIDYIAFSSDLNKYANFKSLRHYLFTDTDTQQFGKQLSDHCPISLQFDFTQPIEPIM